MDTQDITKEILKKLKSDITYFQEKALEASLSENYDLCRELLEKQGEAINTLINMAEAHIVNI